MVPKLCIPEVKTAEHCSSIVSKKIDESPEETSQLPLTGNFSKSADPNLLMVNINV